MDLEAPKVGGLEEQATLHLEVAVGGLVPALVPADLLVERAVAQVDDGSRDPLSVDGSGE